MTLIIIRSSPIHPPIHSQQVKVLYPLKLFSIINDYDVGTHISGIPLYLYTPTIIHLSPPPTHRTCTHIRKTYRYIERIFHNNKRSVCLLFCMFLLGAP